MTRAELAQKSKDIDWYRKNQDAIMKALENGPGTCYHHRVIAWRWPTRLRDVILSSTTG